MPFLFRLTKTGDRFLNLIANPRLNVLKELVSTTRCWNTGFSHKNEVLPTMTSWLLRRESLRLCFMRRVRETWMDLSKIFSREWWKSETIPPNLLPVVRFKINFPSIPNSCFSFCYDTIWGADFAELANVTKPVLVKFLSCFLVHFLLLTRKTADAEKEKALVSRLGLESWKNNFFQAWKDWDLKIYTWYSSFTLQLYFTFREIENMPGLACCSSQTMLLLKKIH